MKPRRHFLGGLLLVVAAAVSVVSDWAALDPRAIGPMASLLALAGLANVALGLGRPAIVRRRREPIGALALLAFALLGVAIVVENVLAPDGPVSYAHAALWGAAAAVTGRLGVQRLRSTGGGDRRGG